jgi:hypothetical protein
LAEVPQANDHDGNTAKIIARRVGMKTTPEEKFKVLNHGVPLSAPEPKPSGTITELGCGGAGTCIVIPPQ